MEIILTEYQKKIEEKRKRIVANFYKLYNQNKDKVRLNRIINTIACDEHMTTAGIRAILEKENKLPKPHKLK